MKLLSLAMSSRGRVPQASADAGRDGDEDEDEDRDEDTLVEADHVEKILTSLLLDY